jgi:hypothetical protein
MTALTVWNAGIGLEATCAQPMRITGRLGRAVFAFEQKDHSAND